MQRLSRRIFRPKQLWLTCCQAYDLAYWKGGNYLERLKVDETLSACVSKVGEPEIASLMITGVRVGGTPYLPTKFSWGYGWSYSRLYHPLTESELAQIKTLSHSLQLDLDSNN